jgi:hypothetical protein
MNFSCRCQDKYSYSFTGLCFSVQKGVPPPPRYDKIVLHISLESLFEIFKEGHISKHDLYFYISPTNVKRNIKILFLL